MTEFEIAQIAVQIFLKAEGYTYQECIDIVKKAHGVGEKCEWCEQHIEINKQHYKIGYDEGYKECKKADGVDSSKPKKYTDYETDRIKSFSPQDVMIGTIEKACKKEYQKGFEEGKKIGYEEGYKLGLDYGRAHGKMLQREEDSIRMLKAFERGCDEGHKKGVEEGRLMACTNCSGLKHPHTVRITPLATAGVVQVKEKK